MIREIILLMSIATPLASCNVSVIGLVETGAYAGLPASSVMDQGGSWVV